MTANRTFGILRKSSAALMSLEALYLTAGGWLQVESGRAMSAFDGREVPMSAVLFAYGVLWVSVVTLAGASVTLWKPSRLLHRFGRYWLKASMLLHGLFASSVVIGVPFAWTAVEAAILIGLAGLVLGTCAKALLSAAPKPRRPKLQTIHSVI